MRSSGGTVGTMNSDLVERYRDRWVAIQGDGSVFADAEDLGRLLAKLEAIPHERTSIQRIPAADDPLFVGLR
jgi:hypothetical protein